eukprot:692786-Karenia_brevis.AAC.1
MSRSSPSLSCDSQELCTGYCTVQESPGALQRLPDVFGRAPVKVTSMQCSRDEHVRSEGCSTSGR